MVLAVDIGNTNIVLGIYKNDKLILTSRISTNKEKTTDEYASVLYNVMLVNNINISDIEGGIISSVVPPLSHIMQEAIYKLIGKKVLLVGPGIKTGLDIKIDNPAQLGSDLVVDAVGALSFFEPPLIIIDMGTATTISVINKNGSYIGGVIIPGVKISLNALCMGAAQLPFIDLEEPNSVISSNTVDCMKSGVIYGFASMIDGMIDKIQNELGEKCTVIATGGMSNSIAKHCNADIIIKPDLLINGLYEIYKKNKIK